MTWKEFKDYVDKQLSMHGKDDSVKVWYIDVGYPKHSGLELLIEQDNEDRDIVAVIMSPQ